MGKTLTKEETLGQRIRAKRKETGYSQEKLAELLMIKQATLSKYESDEYDVPTDVLSLMSKVLDTTLLILCGEAVRKKAGFQSLRS